MYERQVAQAKRMIQKYANNQLSTWRKSNSTSADATKPWNTSSSGTPQDFKVYIVFVQPGLKLQALFTMLQGTSVPMGAPSAIMAQAVDAVSGESFTPAINDTVIAPDNTKYNIKDFNVVRPDGVTAILYKLDLG